MALNMHLVLGFGTVLVSGRHSIGNMAVKLDCVKHDKHQTCNVPSPSKCRGFQITGICIPQHGDQHPHAAQMSTSAVRQLLSAPACLRSSQSTITENRYIAYGLSITTSMLHELHGCTRQ